MTTKILFGVAFPNQKLQAVFAKTRDCFFKAWNAGQVHQEKLLLKAPNVRKVDIKFLFNSIKLQLSSKTNLRHIFWQLRTIIIYYSKTCYYSRHHFFPQHFLHALSHTHVRDITAKLALNMCKTLSFDTCISNTNSNKFKVYQVHHPPWKEINTTVRITRLRQMLNKKLNKVYNSFEMTT